MAYTNKIMIENYLQRSLNENEEAYLVVLIPAVKKWLDNHLGSTFDLEPMSRRYYSGGTQYLDIEPCTTITEVKAINDDGSDSYIYTEGTEYIAEPMNDRVKREICKQYGKFPAGVRRIAVNAIFSEYDAGVPEDIKIIATTMAAEVLNQGAVGSSGTIASESLEGHSVTYDVGSGALDGISANNPNIKSLLEQRKEIYV